MDSGHVRANQRNPRERASILSLIFLTYTFELFKKCFYEDLTIEDLWVPLQYHRSDFMGDLLERKWEEELLRYKLTGKQPSLLRAIVKTIYKDLVYSGLIVLISDSLIRVCQPLLLGRMLIFFSNSHDVSHTEALIVATAIIIISFLLVFIVVHYNMLLKTTFLKTQVALSSLVYRKVLHISNFAAGNSVAGNVLNLICADLKALNNVATFIHHLWLSPVLLAAITCFVWLRVAWPGVAGLCVVFALASALIIAEKFAYAYRIQSNQISDRRIKLLQEILLGVRLIKMYAWEKPFISLVDQVRRAETKVMKKSGFLRGAFLVFTLSASRIACFTVMVCMVFNEQPLNAENKFLLQEELTNAANHSRNVVCQETSGTAVSMENVTARWDKWSNELTLSNINIRVKTGSLVAIIGSTGSGKSSLLHSILGELPLVSGAVGVEGGLSYAGQEPWVFGDTVRQNITFARPHDEQLYDRVVRACGLRADLEGLPRGDRTRVGERGCSQSGGQKARINLARAAYSDAEVFLLDDPLSAVDPHVARHLFHECILSLLEGKTRLLVTHQIQYLEDADHIIVMRNGSVEMQGSYIDLMKSDIDVTRYLKSQENLHVNHDDTEYDTADKCNDLNNTKADAMSIQNFAETSSKGTLKKSVYMEYLLSGSSYLRLLIMALLFLLSQVVANISDYWVLYWTNQEEMSHSNRYIYTVHNVNTSNSEHDLTIHNPESSAVSDEWTSSSVFCAIVYSAVIFALIVLSVYRIILFYTICEACHNNIHSDVIKSIVRTYAKFFDINPSGRILNRLSSDVSVMDESVPKATMDSAQYFLLAVGPLVLISIVNCWFLIAIIVLAAILFIVLRIFLRASKRITRIEGMCRSPIFVHLNSTLQGLTTIRALQAEDVIRQEFNQHQDLNTSASYMLISANQTFVLAVNLICFVVFAIIIVTYNVTETGSNGGEVGLVATQTFWIISCLHYAVLHFTSLPEFMVCVERVMEYKYLEEEKNLDTTMDNFAPPLWPKAGRIEFQNVTFKYTINGPSVLQGINILINPKEKVGIVGRTGAGKSSLILALFRFAEVEGCIVIDAVDTSTISLHDLRKKTSIIPQDPFLFSGSLRENLDRFNEFRDEELLQALEDVEMRDVLTSSGGLGMLVAERGDNFSVGQKQLLCLARAILRKNKILVLDEATANVDLQTDELIQRTLREQFADCTVLTVAHRLQTIMDSDKVVVMSRGNMVEFDHPHILLQNAGGVFYQMVQKTGQRTSLARIASESYTALKERRKEQ
ncbi:ATP-binding cassette sub-family C member 4-like isoform X2 [Bacillus rossius redtenbacheri]|uniref:ATP-binding cassette sub-family C member 4-like isoform X2 n=1 Tax=Bacillus rossius redtenbacheri TaxID=93214 RepID=UPI002FDDC763